MTEDNTLTHELIPEHRILAKEELAKILKELKVTTEQLPKVLDTDPVIEMNNAKIGDVIEITRDSATAGKIKYYRIVIQE